MYVAVLQRCTAAWRLCNGCTLYISDKLLTHRTSRDKFIDKLAQGQGNATRTTGRIHMAARYSCPRIINSYHQAGRTNVITVGQYLNPVSNADSLSTI